MSVILFIVVLFLLVTVHEFGHFIVAKKAGIRVDEFAFGFPPRLWSVKKGETTYAVNALPLGGYVKIYGENPDDISAEGDQRSFIGKPRIVQGLVIIAGVVFNLLLAWLLFSGALMVGVPAPVDGGDGYLVRDPHLIVTEVVTDSPAKEAGLLSGDVLKKLSDGVDAVETETADRVIAFVSPREGHSITIAYERHGRAEEARVVPRTGIVEGRAAIGISMDTVGTLKLPPHVALWVGLQKTYQFTVATAVGTATFLKTAIVGRADLGAVSGPVGIVRAVGDAAGVGFTNVILFTALISINLAIINALPFPALDGGRLLFIVIEGIIRRPIKPKIANALNVAGFAALMLLMLAVTWHDVAKLMY